MKKYLRYKKYYKAIKESGLFDVKYYLFTYPDVRQLGVDPIKHYLKFGANEGRNPSTEFDTQFYLSMNIDVELSNLNPLVHYILHGKNENRRIKTLSKEIVENHIDKDCMLKFKPKISIIVPNYNHAKFLAKRIDSILNQTYTNFELLLLDDCSSDNSRKILLEYERNYPKKIRTIFNEKNAGNVFKQWEKGIEHSKGELIWICESDDFCEDDFLEKIVRHFENPAVNLAFGKIQFCDLNDNFMQGLDNYREGAEKGIWNSIQVRPAKTWFCNGFGINNVIANVGGCVFKKQPLDSKVWDKAKNYKILGDWFLYAHVANGGLIAYEPSAIAYFRQHGANTSVNSFITSKYYQEHFDLMKTLKEMWPIPNSTIDKFYSKIEFQYKHFKCKEKLGKLEQYVNTEVLKNTQKNKKHILISMLAFHSGGGELFPINLANALQQEEGSIVSLFVFNMNDINLDMYKLVDKRIAIYSKDYVESYGVANFIHDAGIDLINSHMLSLDNFFLVKHNINIPYFPTLHGSYEACNVPNQMVENISKKVTSWIYTADKNLNTLKFLNIPKNKLIKLANAMPIDDEPFPKARVDLGIQEDDIVFTLVARGIKRKGWRAAIEAFLKLEQKYSNIHLLLCGEGTETEKYKPIYEKHKKITFLGYQSKIHGLYRISDCAIVPTRFEGESYPLCIIQALQVGLPVIATDVGEIKSMLTDSEGEVAGIILANERNTQLFIKNLELAMNQVIDVERRKKYSNISKKIAKRYNMSDLALKYLEIYNKKKILYIHIGWPKTGTSAIQNFFVENYDILKNQCSVFYPDYGRWNDGSHHNIAFSLRENPYCAMKSELEQKSYLIKLKDIINSSNSKKILLSSECFNLYESYIFKTLFCNEFDIKIICYLRNQDQYIESIYGQNVRDPFFKEQRKFNDFLLSFKKNLFYSRTLKLWESLTNKENFIIRHYDKNKFINNNIIKDFLTIMKIDYDNINFKYSTAQVNISYTKDALEYKRLLNIIVPEQNGKLVQILQKYSLLFPEENSSYLSNEAKYNFNLEFLQDNEIIQSTYKNCNFIIDYEQLKNQKVKKYQGLINDKIDQITYFIFENHIGLFNKIKKDVFIYQNKQQDEKINKLIDSFKKIGK